LIPFIFCHFLVLSLILKKRPLSSIGESGSIGDDIDCMGRLGAMKVNAILPGHGDISKTPDEDMKKAIFNAHTLLKKQMGIEISGNKIPVAVQK
jgi:hypothetical protein